MAASLDQDLETQLAAFEGYGVEPWMKNSVQTALRQVQELRDAVRKHRDERGHDRCWLDDQALYQSLPEALPGDLNLPPKEEFIKNCHAYWEHRQDPTKTYLKQAEVDAAEKCKACTTGHFTFMDGRTCAPYPCYNCNGTMKEPKK